jgi:FkbM family methyltransferase
MTWMFWVAVASLFAHMYWFLHRYARTNVRGLGWLMRRIGKDLILDVAGVKTYMYSPIAGSNAMHLIGRWNEPETHAFLHEVLQGHRGGITFIDVGANVGEMALDLARHPAVAAVFAFEPVPSCCHSLRVATVINDFRNINIRSCAVSNTKGTVGFVTSTTNPSSSGFAGAGNSIIDVATTTLDAEFPDPLYQPIVLLDVEGAEYAALEGARNLVTRDRPLIIFEYNNVSRRHFSLERMQALLGREYEIYRLRTKDGRLDREFGDTWNCVAVHADSSYHERCLRLIVPGRLKQATLE